MQVPSRRWNWRRKLQVAKHRSLSLSLFSESVCQKAYDRWLCVDLKLYSWYCVIKMIRHLFLSLCLSLSHSLTISYVWYVFSLLRDGNFMKTKVMCGAYWKLILILVSNKIKKSAHNDPKVKSTLYIPSETPCEILWDWVQEKQPPLYSIFHRTFTTRLSLYSGA